MILKKLNVLDGGGSSGINKCTVLVLFKYPSYFHSPELMQKIFILICKFANMYQVLTKNSAGGFCRIWHGVRQR